MYLLDELKEMRSYWNWKRKH